MKLSRIALIICFILGLGLDGYAQLSSIRPSARLLHATRGGFFIGFNQSFHNGDIPSNPFMSSSTSTSGITGSPLFVTDESSTNFIFGAHLDKAISKNVSLGLRVVYDQMNLTVDGEGIAQPFRVRLENGELSDVTVENQIDYCIRYVTFMGVMKVYFYRTYGFYFLGGVSFGTLLTGDFDYTPVVVEPSEYDGSTGLQRSDDIPDIEDFRFSLVPGFGYDIYYRGVFITPEIAADIPLTDVLDSNRYSSGDIWRILNIRASLGISFIIL